MDLHRRRRMADRVLRLLSDIQVDRCADECWNTHPIPWKRNQEAYQLRYVFGYAMDGSDLPCYILWPTRTVEQSFWCIDARMHFKVGNYRDGSWESNIRMLTGTIKVDWIQLPVELYVAALPKVSLLGYSGRKVLPPGELPGQRSCNSQFSSAMICLWRIGMQGFMAYQQCGLRLLCWVLTIYAKLLAMIFIS